MKNAALKSMRPKKDAEDVAQKRDKDVSDKARTQVLSFFDRISDPTRGKEIFESVAIGPLDRKQYRELLGSIIADLQIREEAAIVEDEGE